MPSLTKKYQNILSKNWLFDWELGNSPIRKKVGRQVELEKNVKYSRIHSICFIRNVVKLCTVTTFDFCTVVP